MGNHASCLTTTMADEPEQGKDSPSAFEVIEDTVRRMIEHDRKEQDLVSKKEAWRHLIREHESEHSTH